MGRETIDLARNENVVLQKGSLSITLLPYLGGKIASIRVAGRELLQAPLLPYAPRTQSMAFDEADASGWDECLPSVAACSVRLADGSIAQIPDHGDLWRVAWQQTGAGEGTLRGECFSLPLTLVRSLAVSETETGWELRMHYTVTNTGPEAVPWSWAAHPLFAAEAGDRIIFPDSIDSLRLEGSSGNRLGKGGDRVPWPIASLAAGGETDLSVARSIESGIGDKLFAGPLIADENWAILDRPSAGLRIRVSFDSAITPYLGLWLCYGGWPDRPGPKQMCVALEPCTAPVDSLAVTGPWSRTLAPGEWFSWDMSVSIEPLQPDPTDSNPTGQAVC
jgi:galactose mutarotase-like enzyme